MRMATKALRAGAGNRNSVEGTSTPQCLVPIEAQLDEPPGAAAAGRIRHGTDIMLHAQSIPFLRASFSRCASHALRYEIEFNS